MAEGGLKWRWKEVDILERNFGDRSDKLADDLDIRESGKLKKTGVHLY